MAKKSQGKPITDHKKVKTLIEEHDGQPARRKRDGMLVVDFGDADPALEPITWKAFFDIFEDKDFALIYEEEGKGKADKPSFAFIIQEKEIVKDEGIARSEDGEEGKNEENEPESSDLSAISDLEDDEDSDFDNEDDEDFDTDTSLADS